MCGHPWLYMVIHGGEWSCTAVHGSIWLSLVVCGGEWPCMVICSCTRSHTMVSGQTWQYQVVCLCVRSWMVRNGWECSGVLVQSYIVLHGSEWSHMAVVTYRARSLCPQPGAGHEEPPAPRCSLQDAEHQPQLSKEFVSSQD